MVSDLLRQQPCFDQEKLIAGNSVYVETTERCDCLNTGFKKTCLISEVSPFEIRLVYLDRDGDPTTTRITMADVVNNSVIIHPLGIMEKTIEDALNNKGEN